MTSTEPPLEIPVAENGATGFARSKAQIRLPLQDKAVPVSIPADETTATLFDRIGIVLSGLCMVHCIALPLVVPFVTTIAAFAHSEWMHLILAILIVPTVAFSAWSAYRQHGQMSVVWLLGSGTVLVLAAMIAGTYFSSELLEAGITTAGSGLLITGHWQNHTYRELCATELCATEVGAHGKPHKH